MERIVSINAIYTVSTTRVTESMAAVFIVVKMGTNVLKVYFPISINFRLFMKFKVSITFDQLNDTNDT